jgi:hypothetical protein
METMIERSGKGRRGTRAAVGACVVLLATVIAGCEVTNPGPIQDQFLNDPTSHAALVAGAGRGLLLGLNEIVYTSAVASREIFPGGQTGNFGWDPQVQAGSLLWDGSSVGGPWQKLQQARFIAEDAIRRFTTVAKADVTPVNLTQAYIWAGYINRVLGEDMCDAIIDGGPAEPYTKYLERAEDHLTKALTTASESQKQIAYAGRAQVRVLRGDWAGAAADAGHVPDGFTFMLGVDGLNFDTYNWIYWGDANRPYRSYSLFKTWYKDYFTQTGDPRTAWASDPKNPVATAALSGFGQVPWSYPTKYKAETDDWRLAGSQEMRLIEAEALLQGGDWQGAMTKINAVRTKNVSTLTGKPLQPWVAANITEAWGYLKRERSIELWLEGRHFGDLRRWERTKTPGALDWPDFESASPLFAANKRSTCFPIPKSERDTNPNIPSTPEG